MHNIEPLCRVEKRITYKLWPDYRLFTLEALQLVFSVFSSSPSQSCAHSRKSVRTSTDPIKTSEDWDTEHIGSQSLLSSANRLIPHRSIDVKLAPPNALLPYLDVRHRGVLPSRVIWLMKT